MSLLDELTFGGVASEACGHLARSTPATVAGRSFLPVLGTDSREKKSADAGFMQEADAVFTVPNERLEGVPLQSLLGALLNHGGQSYRVNRVVRGGLTTDLFCVAKSA